MTIFNEVYMKILISGSSGLVGKELVSFLTTWGYQVVSLVRDRQEKGIWWDPEHKKVDCAALEGFDAVIHLAGENIASSRWTKKKKQLIRDSRIQGTECLCEALARLKKPPQVLLSASAVGYYGDCRSCDVTEDSPAGEDFLSRVCAEWETSTKAARDAGIRTILMRIGNVLSPEGGALGKMLPPFRLGIGGPLGNGKQYMSWIAIDDLVRAVHHLMVNTYLDGPVNMTAPHPVTNNEFTKALGSALHKPTFMRMPEWVTRLIFGELADAVLLSGNRSLPVRLQSTNFSFLHPTIEDALEYLLEHEKKIASIRR